MATGLWPLAVALREKTFFLGAYIVPTASLLTTCLCSGFCSLPSGQTPKTHAQIKASSRDPLSLVPLVLIAKYD